MANTSLSRRIVLAWIAAAAIPQSASAETAPLVNWIRWPIRDGRHRLNDSHTVTDLYFENADTQDRFPQARVVIENESYMALPTSRGDIVQDSDSVKGDVAFVLSEGGTSDYDALVPGNTPKGARERKFDANSVIVDGVVFSDVQRIRDWEREHGTPLERQTYPNDEKLRKLAAQLKPEAAYLRDLAAKELAAKSVAAPKSGPGLRPR